MCRNFDKTYWHYYFNIKINFAKFFWPTWPIYIMYIINILPLNFLWVYAKTRVTTLASYRISQAWFYMNVLAYSRSCPSRYLNSLENFSRPRHFSPQLVKKVPRGREKGGNERDFSWIRGGVKRMRGANAFIRSVTITQVERGARVPSLRQDSRERFFGPGAPRFEQWYISSNKTSLLSTWSLTNLSSQDSRVLSFLFKKLFIKNIFYWKKICYGKLKSSFHYFRIEYWSAAFWIRDDIKNYDGETSVESDWTRELREWNQISFEIVARFALPRST